MKYGNWSQIERKVAFILFRQHFFGSILKTDSKLSTDTETRTTTATEKEKA